MKLEELQRQYDRSCTFHTNKFAQHIGSEENYRASCREMFQAYQELALAKKEAGEPIPVQF